MAIETAWIASYKGPQLLSFSYYAHKSDADSDKGPAGTVLEQELRISLNGDPEYNHQISTVYDRETIFKVVKAGAQTWKERQLGLAEVKTELKDLESMLAKG